MAFTRRQFVTASSLAVIGGSLRHLPLAGQQPAPASSQPSQPAQPPPVVPVFTALRRNVGTFTGRGGTIGWLIAPDAVAIVDSQFPDAAQVFVNELKPRTSRRIDLVLNSHHHPDHTGGNKVLRATAAKIVAHENSATWQRKQAAAQKTEEAQAYPDETFKDAWKADLGAETISAKYYGPGHTSGDVAIHFERANVVHLGDLGSHYRHPRADRPSGASVRNWIPVLERIAKDHDNDTIYIYGHSKPGAPVSGPRADVLLMRDYLTAVVAYVQKAVAAGTPIDDVVKTTTLAGFPQHEGDFTFLLRATYEELSVKS